jgi:signal transduction histidine kinase
MASTANDQIPAYLRHEYRTPVNHIVGYSELLTDESRERQLETWVPAFRQIQQGGRRLLELIQNAFGRPPVSTEEISGILTSVTADLNRGHYETFADLAAISGGIGRLNELAGRRAGGQLS